MIIQDIEAFKTWLIKVLSPICNADAVTLSKYVVALVKKDLPPADLKVLCLDQLAVFLHDKCTGFVNQLFDTLTDMSYLPSPSQKVDVADVQPIPKRNDPVGNAPQSAVHSSHNENETTRKPTEPSSVIDHPSEMSRRRHSRSPSPRQSRRNSDRPGDDRRRRHDNRSRHYPRDDRRHRSRSRSPPRRSPRNRSWTNRDKPHRSPPYHPPPRSRSKTPPPTDLRKLISTANKIPRLDSRSPTPIAENGPRYEKARSPARSSPSISNAPITVVTNTVSEKNRYQGATSSSRSHMRCRDYDEKGYCMRGDMCPFDHGNDPLIVEDIDVPSEMPFGPAPPGQTPMMHESTGMPQRMPHPGPSLLGPRPGQRMPFPPHINEGYNPEDPGLNAPPRLRFPPYWVRPPPLPLPPGPLPPGMHPRFMPHPHVRPDMNLQGQGLITDTSGVPFSNNRLVLPPKDDAVTMTTMSQQDPLAHPSSEEALPQGTNNQTLAAKKQPFDYNRLGTYRKGGYNATNMTLEVRKIPREFNTISKLNEHFSKFGTLKNIQVSYDNDPEAALVTFVRHCDAQSAYRSSDPLFQNRFIKVFWFSPKDEDQATSKPDHTVIIGKPKVIIPPSHKLQLNNKITDNPEKAVTYSADGSIQRTVFTSTTDDQSKPVLASSDATPSDDVTKPIAPTTQKTTVIKKNLELQKQKQSLLEEYLQQQKLLIAKLESKTATDEKMAIKTTIRELADKIDKLKLEIATSKPQPPKSAKEKTRELLDTELDLITKENSGLDTTDLRRKLNVLQKQAQSLGLMSRGRGRGSVNRGRYSSWSSFSRGRYKRTSASRSIDRRSKQMEVSGFSNDSRDDLLPHLTKHGEVETITYNDTGGSALVTFKTRMDAEKASIRGIRFGNEVLKMRWHDSMTSDTNLIHPDSTAVPVTDDIAPEDIDEDALLAADDDDVEESRSWRR